MNSYRNGKNLPLKIFCSYAHQDEDIMEDLRTHLASLRLTEHIEDWHDRQIPPGGDWEKAIKEQLDAADIILLLISPNFINSPYCMDVETKQALQREKKGTATVIPIFSRQCVIKGLAFEFLQGTPQDCKWITQHDFPDKAYSEVVKTIYTAVEQRCSIDESLVNSGSDSPVTNQSKISEPTAKENLKFQYISLLVIFLLVATSAFWYFKPVPTNPWDSLLIQGEYRQARKLCQVELKHTPDSRSAQQCITITGLMLDTLDPEVFYAKAQGFFASNPKSPYALAIMAESYAAREDWNKAEEYYQRALQRNAGFAQAHYGLGQIDQLQNRPDLALAHYQNAISFAPENRRYRQNLASLYTEQGEYQQAEQQFKQLSIIDKKLVLSYVEWINVLLLQGKFTNAYEVSKTLNEILQITGVWQEDLNKTDWFFTTDDKPVYFERQQDKETYIKLQYALVALLVEKEKLDETFMGPYPQVPLNTGIAYLLEYDMQRIQHSNPQAHIPYSLNAFLHLGLNL